MNKTPNDSDVKISRMAIPISAWTFSDAKSIPPPGAPIHMNLYLFEGRPPDSKEGNLAVILDSFEFTPLKK